MMDTPAATGGGAAVVAALRANGVRIVFGIPGTHNLEIYRHLENSGIQHVLFRHEQGAAYAADGYSRTGAGIAAVIVTSGPGLLNAASGIANAYADRVPMLVLAPVIDRGRQRRNVGWMHEVKDQRAALDAVADWSEAAVNTADAGELVNRAFMEWNAGETRPVVIHIPHDVLTSSAVAEEVRPLPAPLPGTPTRGTLETVHESLISAQSPIVVTGGGCVKASGALTEFLEQFGAPVIATGRGKGVIPDTHHLSLGPVVGTDSARQELESADTVLLLGTELSEAELADQALNFSGTVIRVDRDLDQLHKGAVADLPVLADVDQFAAGMLEFAGWNPSDTQRIEDLRTKVEAEVTSISAPFASVHRALQEALPADAIIVGDSSQVSYLGTTLLWQSEKPDHVINTLGFATLGYGLPAAIGAALGNPNATVACVLGDGAFMFSVQELSTAVELGLALPIVVFDNDGFGEIRDQMSMRSITHLGVDIEQPDFTEIAAAFGCRFARSKTESELVEALQKSLSIDRPTVILVRADEFE